MRKVPVLLGLLVIAGFVLGFGSFGTSAGRAQAADERKAVFAPIESVEVFNPGSAPTGHALKVVAGLPGGCAQPLDSGVNRFNDIIVAYVLNSMPADDNTPCTRIYGSYEVTLDLGADFVPGRQYTAYVNDTLVHFVAQGGIVPTPDRISVPAPIDSVDIAATASLPAMYEARIVAGLPSGCARPNDYALTREGNTIAIDVTNTVPAERSVCTAIYGTYPLSIDLGSDFVSGQTYTVLVNGEPYEFTAY